MVSDMDAMFTCVFNLCDVRMRIAITCIVPRVYIRVLFKKGSVFWVGFIRGKSVKEELNIEHLYLSAPFSYTSSPV